MAKGKGSQHSGPKKKTVKSDPLEGVGMPDEVRGVVGGNPLLKRFVLAWNQRTMDAGKLQEIKKYVDGKKFADLPDAVKAFVRERLPEAQRMAENASASPKPSPPSSQRGPGGHANQPGRNQPTRPTDLADPSTLGSPFQNPYTFIPFPDTPPARQRPTLRTVEELPGTDRRHTGILDLQLVTLSPLMTCDPDPVGSPSNETRRSPRHEQPKRETTDPKGKEHRTYKALTYGNDVVLPATGVRGALRSLMTILAGGTLDYVDEHLFLMQGRDLSLGPFGASERKAAFLARIAAVGPGDRPTRLQLGQTRLIDLASLKQHYRGDVDHSRPGNGKPQKPLWCSQPRQAQGKKDGTPVYTVGAVSARPDNDHPWQVKLSGRPVNQKGQKLEGAFLADDERVVELPADIGQDFVDRQRHADIKRFRVGDLVWIEHQDAQATTINTVDDIAGIHWARWARKGVNVLDFIEDHHPGVLPDAWAEDGKVDTVSDLFGQVPMIPLDKDGRGPATAFAARIRPENLVFPDAASRLTRTTLAPLMQPHPGCVAFYRDNPNPNKISSNDPLRGYKVYRNTSERGEAAPWHFNTQPVYGNDGKPAGHQQKVNKTADLLDEGQIGQLRITFLGLTDAELALLAYACTVDWRLGGGRPLGLGHCRITKARWIDENGAVHDLFQRPAQGYPEPAELPAELAPHIDTRLSRGRQLWHASQKPVALLRYPRAFQTNNKGNTQRGGHQWFTRCASPKKGTKANGAEGRSVAPGLQATRPQDASPVAGQTLPKLNPDAPDADVLYGYDIDMTGWTAKD